MSCGSHGKWTHPLLGVHAKRNNPHRTLTWNRQRIINWAPERVVHRTWYKITTHGTWKELNRQQLVMSADVEKGKKGDEVSARQVQKYKMHNVCSWVLRRCARIKITKHKTLNKQRALRELLFARIGVLSRYMSRFAGALFTSFVYSPLISCLSNRTASCKSTSPAFLFEDFAFVPETSHPPPKYVKFPFWWQRPSQ